MQHPVFDTIALIVGYVVIFCSIVIAAVSLLVFYLPDKIIFHIYQKKSMKKIMNYANEKPNGEKINTVEKPIYKKYSPVKKEINYN